MFRSRLIRSRVFAGFLAASAWVACESSALAAVNVGDKPELRLKTTDGQAIDLKSLRGRIVVLDFWTVTDAARRFEAKLVELKKQYADQGVVIIGICCDHDWARAQAFAKEFGMDWPQYWDGQMWQSSVVLQWDDNPHVQTILLAPDGSVLWKGSTITLERELQVALIQHPPQLVDPQVLAKAIEALDSAEKALTGNDHLAAIKAFAAIPQETQKDKAFARRLAEVEPKVQGAAKQTLTDIDALIQQRQYAAAANRLNDLDKSLNGTFIAGDVRQKLKDLLANPDAKEQLDALKREAEAEEALAAARRLRAEQKDDQAYPRFKGIVLDYPATRAAEEAAQAVKAYEQDKELMRRLKEQATASKAKAALSMARSYVAAERYDLAAERYREVIEQFPGTPYAETARKELDGLPGQ